MENHNPWTILQFSRICNFSRSRHDNEYHKDNHHNTNNANRNYLWAVISILLFPVEVFASTTVASPNSTAQGVVNNNATMITPSGVPTNKYSQGIICSSPSLTITPYMTDAWSFNRPIEQVTRQNIYDEDTGEIKYVQETPRFEKDNYNLNYGISMQFNIPLGKGQDLCQRAAKVNIKAQELLIEKTKMEMALYRLKICGEQAKLGVQFVGDYAVSCEGIKVTIPPNQVIPHTHEIKKEK